VENLSPNGVWTPDCPACRELLYGLDVLATTFRPHYNMQTCEDPHKCSCLLAGLEGSPWSHTAPTNKGCHTAALRKDRLTCCCTSGSTLHVPCSVFICSSMFKWYSWLMCGRMHHCSSGLKTPGIVLRWHSVMRGHRTAFLAAQHLWEAITLQTDSDHQVLFSLLHSDYWGPVY
jgi:hypothetical protein